MEKQQQNSNDGTAKRHREAYATDGSAHFTPTQVAARWGWHPESVRRAIRQRRFEYVVISGRILVPVAEVERVENEGRVQRAR